MYRLTLFLVAVSFILGCSSGNETKEVFKKTEKPEMIQLAPGKPTRILLKRTSKGAYSWELRGDNLDEIIEIDKRLRGYARENNK